MFKISYFGKCGSQSVERRGVVFSGLGDDFLGKLEGRLAIADPVFGSSCKEEG